MAEEGDERGLYLVVEIKRDGLVGFLDLDQVDPAGVPLGRDDDLYRDAVADVGHHLHLRDGFVPERVREATFHRHQHKHLVVEIDWRGQTLLARARHDPSPLVDRADGLGHNAGLPRTG